MVIVTPLSSTGNPGTRRIEPTAVRDVTAGESDTPKLAIASDPGPMPVNDAGVVASADTTASTSGEDFVLEFCPRTFDLDGVDVTEAGEAVMGKPLAPVKKLVAADPRPVAVGFNR
jgi:hypothetical protein